MTSGSQARAIVRLAMFAIGSTLVAAGAAGAMLSRYPTRWAASGRHDQRWGRFGRRCLGIRVRTAGPLPPQGSLVVANHLSYADILTIAGLFPCVFVARHDMRAWPLFGALAASGGTIFMNRTLRRQGARSVSRVAAALSAGATVVAFPEGTSSDGSAVLPFHAGIFQAAVDARAAVVPAAVRYLELDGEPVDEENVHVVAWFRNEPFLEHALRLASHRTVTAEVRFASPIPPPHADRRSVASAAEARVRELRGLGTAAPAVAFAGGRLERGTTA